MTNSFLLISWKALGGRLSNLLIRKLTMLFCFLGLKTALQWMTELAQCYLIISICVENAVDGRKLFVPQLLANDEITIRNKFESVGKEKWEWTFLSSFSSVVTIRYVFNISFAANTVCCFFCLKPVIDNKTLLLSYYRIQFSYNSMLWM